MIEIYRAGSQLWKVRAIMLVSLAAAIGASWYGWDIFRSYGLRPADGGVLAPFGTRLAFGGFVALLGIAFAAGMWLYGRVYLSAIRFDPAADAVHLQAAGFPFGGRATVHSPSDILDSSWMVGEFANSGGVSVKAPWIKLDLKGRRLPLMPRAISRTARWRHGCLSSADSTSQSSATKAKPLASRIRLSQPIRVSRFSMKTFIEAP